MLTIGEFSRICFVTKKTLRYYDEIGLLRPEHIAENGYRYYTANQLHTMLLISRLKSYGLSLPEIAFVLANPDTDLLVEKLLEKRKYMKEELDHTHRILAQLEEDVEKLKRGMDLMEQNIIVKTVELEPQKIFSIRKEISIKEFEELFAEVYQQMTQEKLQPTGGPMAFYHCADFNPESSDIEVAIPIDGGEGKGVRTQEGGLHCFATLVGPYQSEAFTTIYAVLAQWIEDNGYRINGAPFDKYVQGGEGVPPEEYVTEIYFPIAQ